MALEFFRKEANFIKYMISHPCARPWFVYVELFIPAFIKLLITVVLFDIDDAIRAHGEGIVRDKKGGKKKRHGTKIKTTAQQTRVQRYAQKGLKILLVVTKPTEKVGFQWLIFSAVDQFFADWQSLIEESDYCVDRGQSGPLTLQRGPGFISIVVGYVPVILNITSQDRAGWFSSTLSVDLPRGSFGAYFGLTVVGPTGGVNAVKIRLRSEGAFVTEITESDPLALEQGEEGDLVVVHNFSFPLIGGGSLTWEIGNETIPAGIESVKGFMTVFRDLPGGT